MPTNGFRTVLPALLALAVLAGCQREKAALPADDSSGQLPSANEQVTAVDPQAETQRLTEWLDARYEEELRFSPISLTVQGRKELYDQIDDASEAAVKQQLDWKANTVEELKTAFDYNDLTDAGKESYDLWVFQYEDSKAQYPFMRQEYLFGELGGSESFLPTFLINFHKVDTLEDMQAYISRIGGISRAIGQIMERGKLAAADGIRPPQFAYDTAIEHAQKVVSGQPFRGEGDAPLWADARNKISALQEAGKIDEETAQRLREQTQRALLEQFRPAYASLIEWLKTDRASADEVARGVSALPKGTEFYNRQLAKYTTLDMTADQVHQLGLREVARIRAEMEAIKTQVGFEGSLQDFFGFIREDKQFYYPNTDDGREAYIADTRGFLEEISGKLPEYFGILPKADLVVKRVEPFREVDGGAQHYYPGTPDGSRPGTYYVHMSDMSGYSKTDMETTAYHEGNPGHHMQISIAQELQDIPRFRTQAGFSVYSEGWALYSENLAKQMGQFKNPYMDFGRLTAEMWRAIRLVVDTGLHAKGWTQQQAEDFFLENSAVPESAVRSEVRRYLTLPGQATSYKVGMLKIGELRDEAQQALGDQFDIREFHDTVLGGGAMPMPMLEKRVDNWIAQVK